MTLHRRFIRGFALAIVIAAGAACLALIAVQTESFKDWLRTVIVRASRDYLNGDLSIGRLSGTLFSSVDLHDVIVRVAGQDVIAVKNVHATYNITELISKGWVIRELTLTEPRLEMRRDGDSWSIAHLVRTRSEDTRRQGTARPIVIDAIHVADGAVAFDDPLEASGVIVPRHIANLQLDSSLRYEESGYTVAVRRLALQGATPTITLTDASGRLSVRDDDLQLDRIAIRTLDTSVAVNGTVHEYLQTPHASLTVSADRFSPAELAGLVPAFGGITVRPAFEIAAHGPTDMLHVNLNARSEQTVVSASLIVGLMPEETAISGDVSMVHLDLGAVTGRAALRSDVSANARVKLRQTATGDRRLFSGTIHVDGGRTAAFGYAVDRLVANASLQGSKISMTTRASAYGASTDAMVVVDWSGATVQYDIQGRAHGVNLSKLPDRLSVPPAPTDVNADYRVRANQDGIVSVNARFLSSTIGGAEIGQDSEATLDRDDTGIRYTANVNLSNLNLRQVGHDFAIPDLDSMRFESAMNGHVTVDAAGTVLKEMRLDASGDLTDSTFAGVGIPDLAFTGSLSQDFATVMANGHIRDVNPASLGAPDTLKGRLDAAFDIDASMKGVSLGRDADTVAHLKVNVQPSTIGSINVERAEFEGTYRGDVADITQFCVDGANLHLDAAGTLSLTAEEPSNLTFHANSTDLKVLGDALGVPVTGIGKIDGSVDGDQGNLHVSGNLTADNLTYGTTQALKASATYTVRIPDLQIADATVTADTKATFVVLGGQEINELSAKIAYEDRQMMFDTQAKQPERSLSVKGSLRLLPEQEQVRLEHLTVQARGHEWQTTPGTTAEVDYGEGAIALRNLSLLSGSQHITAEGTFGRPGGALNVTLADVDLNAVDALLLREPQFSGRLNLTGAVTGTKDEPKFNGQFRVEQGAFRKFQYQELAGTVDSSASGVTLDIRLQQNPSAWITAKGYVPFAVFTPEEDGQKRSSAHEVASNPADDFDLRLESGSIDLGVVQAFTTALTDVQGALQANIRIAGTAHDPHPEGEISISNGSATAKPIGVKYSGLNGRLELAPDRMRIDNLRIQDDNRHEMVIEGDLAIHERQLGGVNVTVNADGFTVLKNEMGRVHLDSKLRLGGDLAKPRIEGDLAISSGRVELDPLIESFSSAYAVKPAEYEERTTQAGTPAADTPPAETRTAGSLYDRLAMNVHFKVPDDLVVRGTDLKVAGSPVSLGAVNATLGGDLQAQKDSGGPLRLTGTVNTVRGTYDFQGRRFEILRSGSIRFAGLDTLEPTLDVRARRVIQSVEAHVNVRGTLKRPRLILTSDPPLEQADILALIVFNQPVNELGEGQQTSLAQRATALATGAVAGELATSLGKALNLDTFDIQTATDSSTTVQVTAGQQIGERAFVKVEQGIGDQSQTNFVFDYQFRDWLRLQSNVLMGASIQQSLFHRAQDTGVDILFTFPSAR